MHARINYVDIKPESFGELEPFWRDLVAAYDGLVTGYFLRDDDTPHTLSVVLFESEKAMLDNTHQQLGETVRRVAAHRLSEPELHHLEVCASVDGAHGDIGCARVADVAIKVDRLDEVIAGWPKDVARYREGPGFRRAYLCLDRGTGACRSVSLWGARADVDANEQSGAFKAAVEPYRAMLARDPAISYWDVRIVVP